MKTAIDWADEIQRQIEALGVVNTSAIRSVRRRLSRDLRDAAPESVMALAQELLGRPGLRFVAFELILNHPPAFRTLDADKLEQLGQGMNSWWTVDDFARTLAGPAWLAGLIPDSTIQKWAHSPDRWWRRAALASTVALNMRSKGGAGDVPRTLSICRLLVNDHDDMVAKAMSWALRQLVVHDPGTVRRFIRENERQLAARVKREVRNKLATGLKNPGRRAR